MSIPFIPVSTFLLKNEGVSQRSPSRERGLDRIAKGYAKVSWGKGRGEGQSSTYPPIPVTSPALHETLLAAKLLSMSPHSLGLPVTASLRGPILAALRSVRSGCDAVVKEGQAVCPQCSEYLPIA